MLVPALSHVGSSSLTLDFHHSISKSVCSCVCSSNSAQQSNFYMWKAHDVFACVRERARGGSAAPKTGI